MQLKQLSIDYLTQEDRLCLKIRFQEQAEIRLFLTRRLIKRLLPGLRDYLIQQQPIGDVSPDQAAQVAAFNHQAVTEQTDFDQPYDAENVSEHPLGDQPLLVERIDLTAPAEGRSGQARFFLVIQQVVTLQLNEQLWHALLTLLSEGVRRSDWDVDPELFPAHLGVSSRLN